MAKNKLDNPIPQPYTLPMKQEIEPRSDIKPSSVWSAARAKVSKKHWSFKNARNRGNLPELPPKIKQIGFRTGVFQFGPYKGTLEEIKEFARMKGLESLKCGAVNYKTA